MTWEWISAVGDGADTRGGVDIGGVGVARNAPDGFAACGVSGDNTGGEVGGPASVEYRS